MTNPGWKRRKQEFPDRQSDCLQSQSEAQNPDVFRVCRSVCGLFRAHFRQYWKN